MHNLVYLADLCKEVDAEMERLPEDVTRLNPFAVDARYPASSEAPPPGSSRNLSRSRRTSSGSLATNSVRTRNLRGPVDPTDHTASSTAGRGRLRGLGTPIGGLRRARP